MSSASSIWPQGYGLIRHGEIDSTNSEARRLAEAGETGPVWISADRQTAGRGRRGRTWDSGSGNLAATLLLRPPADFAQLSFAAALAVSDTAAHFAPSVRIAVKWPNDVLAGGRKLAGILLESGQDAKGTWLAIGVGINLAGHPDGTEFPATSLLAFVTPPSPEQALTILAARFAYWYDAWMKQGFKTLRAAWLARAGGLGATIRARLPHETRHGVFEGIDASGALLLNEQGTVRAITAGEVFF
ncbi:MAG: biotin--acetyl-CoA-carboxylase ligase [Alphaproteobacteria bacterium]|nr:biotin--acetyl-CoA-carboxylase ligase [Alphaproteobacteria bacterium]MDB5741296.1 biotin--acetyl-CoA-carboxylase ligase [Alphaproteobacteria bacterium]